MKRDYAKKRPIALFTWDDSDCYFAVNPNRVTALELMGEDASEFFSTYSEAAVRTIGGNDELYFPNKEMLTTHFFQSREFPALIFEFSLEGIYQIHHKKRILKLMHIRGKYLHWVPLLACDLGKGSMRASQMVFVCQQIENPPD